MSGGADLVLAKLDSARIALIEAKTIQAAKKVADIAKAMKVYSAQQKLGKEVEAHAHAIFIEAMRRVGEMLADTERQGPGQYKQMPNGSELVPFDIPPTIEDLGLTKKESALAQKVAALPEEEFEAVKAVAMQAYARQAQDRELIGWATDIRLRAERKAGQLRKEMPKPDGGDAQRTRFHKGTESPPTLEQLKITKKQSSRWQRLADMSDDAFEAIVIDQPLPMTKIERDVRKGC